MVRVSVSQRHSVSERRGHVGRKILISRRVLYFKCFQKLRKRSSRRKFGSLLIHWVDKYNATVFELCVLEYIVLLVRKEEKGIP